MSEMGDGDSDGEFFSRAPSPPAKKAKNKFSYQQGKVEYNYKFDLSSDDEEEAPKKVEEKKPVVATVAPAKPEPVEEQAQIPRFLQDVIIKKDETTSEADSAVVGPAGPPMTGYPMGMQMGMMGPYMYNNAMGYPNPMGMNPQMPMVPGMPNPMMNQGMMPPGMPGPNMMNPGMNMPGPNMMGPGMNMPGPNMMGPGMNMPGPNMNMPNPNMMGPGMNMPGPMMGPPMNMPGPNMMNPGMSGPNMMGPGMNNMPGPNMMGPGMNNMMGPGMNGMPGPNMMGPGMNNMMGPGMNGMPGPNMMGPGMNNMPGPNMMGPGMNNMPCPNNMMGPGMNNMPAPNVMGPGMNPNMGPNTMNSNMPPDNNNSVDRVRPQFPINKSRINRQPLIARYSAKEYKELNKSRWDDSSDDSNAVISKPPMLNIARKESEKSSSSQELPGDASAVFRNDGSFLEVFKKLKDDRKDSEEVTKAEEKETVKKPQPKLLPSMVGKRRGGRVLKTGVVEKLKKIDAPDESAPKDAWSLYMAEVKKYREINCEEEGKTRALVK